MAARHEAPACDILEICAVAVAVIVAAVAVRPLDAITAVLAVAVIVDVVFVLPSCGCDTPMNASVSNGFAS